MATDATGIRAADTLSSRAASWPPRVPPALPFPADELAFGSTSRQQFARMWRGTVKRAELSGLGFHALRHYYASLLIRDGESVKTAQARLGHASAAETLDTYGHLWPDSDDWTRAAVDDVFGAAADQVRTSRDVLG